MLSSLEEVMGCESKLLWQYNQLVISLMPKNSKIIDQSDHTQMKHQLVFDLFVAQWLYKDSK